MLLKHKRIRRKAVALTIAAAALAVLSATVVRQSAYTPFDKEFYLTDEQILLLRPGYTIEIQDVEIAADRTVSVIFSVSDDAGLPLDLDGVETPGPIRASFVLGTIPQGGGQYVSYINRTQTSPITGDSASQPTSDSGGTFEKIEDGLYRYTLATKLPEGFDPNATHSVGVYSDRNLSDFDLPTPASNDVFTFVPSGAPVVDIRELTTTATCNQCHDPLRLHGRRTEVALCIMCHTTGVIDPDTGSNVDFPNMIHKIHRGEDLEFGYTVIGYRQSVHDYSEVVFPQDQRNCTTCHIEEAAQHDAYLLNPTRLSCGACHDEVNFASGENHLGGPQISDNLCAFCHFPQGELEFDSSIMGAHTIPSRSTQLAGINIEILDVQNSGPGQNPTVQFSLRNNAGETIDPTSLPFLNLVMAGPTTDISVRVSEGAQGATPLGGGEFSYTFETPIPADASGTFIMGAESFRMVPLNAGTVWEFMHRETAENPVFYFPVTDAEPVPRRLAVTDAQCEMCHENLNLHGTIRHNTEYCVMCHNPLADDSPFRAEEDLPIRSIDFRFMIHRIHMGEELTRDYTIIGFMGGVHNYNHVLYPGDVRNCAKCHTDDAYNVPSPGVLSVPTPREFFTPIPPNSAACLGCHDTVEAAAHAFLNIAPFGEACGACHGEEAELSVERVHAR